MARRPRFEDEVRLMPPGERLERARRCIGGMMTRVSEVIELDEQTRIIPFSGAVALKIPPDAGPAFARLRDSLYRFQTVRAAALWDSPGRNRNSVPTAVALLDDADTVKELARVTRGQWLNKFAEPGPDAALYRSIDEDWAIEQGEKAERRLRAALTAAAATRDRLEMSALRNIRDHISHDLTETHAEEKLRLAGGGLPRITYDDARELQDGAIAAVQELQQVVNWYSATADDERAKARAAAEALWLGIRFDDPEKAEEAFLK